MKELFSREKEIDRAKRVIMSVGTLYVHSGGFSSAFAEILAKELGLTALNRVEVDLHSWQQFTYVSNGSQNLAGSVADLKQFLGIWILRAGSFHIWIRIRL